MSEVRKCIKELVASGAETPGTLARIEPLNDERTRHYRICDACTNIGNLVMERVPAAGLLLMPEGPIEVGGNCGAEIVAAQKAKNIAAAAEQAIQAAGQAEQPEPTAVPAEIPVVTPDLTPLIVATQPQEVLA